MRSHSQQGRPPQRSCQSQHQRGFTYLWVLVAVAILGVGLQAVSEVWVTSVRRQKLEELDWIGAQFTQAIGSYYLSSPGGVRAYPATLQDLLEDRRFATTRRYLRVVYANPFTGKVDWELVLAADGRVRGVRAVISTDGTSTVREYSYRPTS
jgi:type II secretory pathway pseudopilin PulG